MTWIKTNSNLKYDYENPTVDMISEDDILYCLSKEQRFGNHLHRDWSVGQHVLLVALLVDIKGGTCHQIEQALYHDDAEAYFLDVPTPLKRLLRDYQRYYSKCENVISEKFDIDITRLDPLVKECDRLACEIEDFLFNVYKSDWHDFDQNKMNQLMSEDPTKNVLLHIFSMVDLKPDQVVNSLKKQRHDYRNKRKN